jgi:predicted nucleic acid-binding Zn ribbon protein
MAYAGVLRFENCPNCGQKNKYNRKFCSRKCQYEGYILKTIERRYRSVNQ